MPKFKTHEERMRHRQAKLIPQSMWVDNEVFYENLDDKVLSLMKVAPANLMSHLQNLAPKLNDRWLKRQAWLVIALSRTDLSLANLQEISSILGLDGKQFFYLLVYLGNKAHLTEYSKQNGFEHIGKMLPQDAFYAYRKAAEYGHVEMLELFEAKASKEVVSMLSIADFAAYRFAAANGHCAVLTHLETLVNTLAPTLMMNMISAQNFFACRQAAANGYAAVVKHLGEMAPHLVQNMVAADDFFAYRKAKENGHVAVCQLLAEMNKACLALDQNNQQENVMPSLQLSSDRFFQSIEAKSFPILIGAPTCR